MNEEEQRQFHRGYSGNIEDISCVMCLESVTDSACMLILSDVVPFV